MKNMSVHSQEFDWAASWFKFLFYVGLLGAALGLIGTILLVLSGRSFSAKNIDSMQLITVTNTAALIVSSLLSAFLFRVGFIICSFLSDFAGGLAMQQIKREHHDKS